MASVKSKIFSNLQKDYCFDNPFFMHIRYYPTKKVCSPKTKLQVLRLIRSNCDLLSTLNRTPLGYKPDNFE